MINIVEKYLCCGCEACVQACPKHCISFDADQEGFRYPVVSQKQCINCGLCEKVCPVINQSNAREPLHSYAAKNNCEVERLKSSSGGVFIMLAKKTIGEGGVVFGARFDDKWNVVHSYTETIDGIKPFMGSKYVQSRIGDSYIKVREFLLVGRKVLFSGTPCQITGLKRFLRKDYDNLLTVDLICHGVPSPAVWQQYLEEIKENAHLGVNSVSLPLNPPISECEALASGREVEIKSISFRDKRLGWKKFSFALTLAEASADGKKNTVSLSQIHDNDPYFLGFNDFNLYLRPSCMKCPTRDLRSGSDITLADFWGIETLKPELDDDKGISVIMTNTNKGQLMVQSLGIELHSVSFTDIVSRNSSIKMNSIPTPLSGNEIFVYRKWFSTKRDYFFYDSKRNVIERVKLLGKPSFKQLIRSFLKKVYYSINKRQKE